MIRILASSSNLVGTKNRTSTEKLHLVVKSVSSGDVCCKVNII